MAVDITALYCCLDDFCKVFADWEAHRLLPSEQTRQRSGKLSRTRSPGIQLGISATAIGAGAAGRLCRCEARRCSPPGKRDRPDMISLSVAGVRLPPPGQPAPGRDSCRRALVRQQRCDPFLRFTQAVYVTLCVQTRTALICTC